MRDFEAEDSILVTLPLGECPAAWDAISSTTFSKGNELDVISDGLPYDAPQKWLNFDFSMSVYYVRTFLIVFLFLFRNIGLGAQFLSLTTLIFEPLCVVVKFARN